jgi:hypothetical protein
MNERKTTVTLCVDFPKSCELKDLACSFVDQKTLLNHFVFETEDFEFLQGITIHRVQLIIGSLQFRLPNFVKSKA